MIRVKATTFRTMSAIVLVPMLWACAEPSRPESPPLPSAGSAGSGGAAGTRPAGEPRLITVEGRIMDGVECPILETDDGATWALSLGDADVEPGDYVRFTGEVADASFCMEGQGTLIADSVVAIDSPAVQ